MKNKQILNTIILQYENFKIHYSQHPISKTFSSVVYDTIILECKTVFSNYKSIKVNDIVILDCNINPYLMDEKCSPTAFGGFISKEDKKHRCYVSVAPSFPDRLNFALMQNINPYFCLGCERESREKPTLKDFYMDTHMVLEDYV